MYTLNLDSQPPNLRVALYLIPAPSRPILTLTLILILTRVTITLNPTYNPNPKPAPDVVPKDFFYDRCDELGLLIYHDAMFNNGIFPTHSAFLESVTEEVS